MKHRRNPSLVIYNPPSRMRHSGRIQYGYMRSLSRGVIVKGLIASNVEQVKYFDEEKLRVEGDGHWEHSFDDTEVMAYAIEQSNGQRDILLTSAKGTALWFEEGEE